MARTDASYWKLTQRDGVRCPDCQCADLPVYGTLRIGTRIKRYRSCRNCGRHPIITWETVADADGRSKK